MFTILLCCVVGGLDTVGDYIVETKNERIILVGKEDGDKRWIYSTVITLDDGKPTKSLTKCLRYESIIREELADKLLERDGRLRFMADYKALSDEVMIRGFDVFCPEIYIGTTFGSQVYIPFRTSVNEYARYLEPDALLIAVQKANEELSTLTNRPVQTIKLKRCLESLQKADKLFEDYESRAKDPETYRQLRKQLTSGPIKVIQTTLER